MLWQHKPGAGKHSPPAQQHTPAQAAPNYTAPRVSYLPGRHYSAAELIEIASTNPPRAETKSEFLNTMATAFNRPNSTRLHKAALCKHISKLMGQDDAIDFQGAPRQANYFASYCIDLNCQELDVAYNITMEQDIREMLNRWANTLCPAQTQFNLDGVIYSREEINTMLANPTLIHRNASAQHADLASGLDRALRQSNSQNVHTTAVRSNAVRVMAIMQEKHGQSTELSDAQITRFLNPAIGRDTRHINIHAGLNLCLRTEGHDPNSPGAMTPKRILGHVCQYIQATKNRNMKSNLTTALLSRLDEIHRERPCVVGVSQRLLDVPNGIDPDMEFAGRAMQLEQDVAALAGKTYGQFSELIEEGVEAVKIAENQKELTTHDETINNIGQNMFVSRLKNDLSQLGGVAEADIAPHRERLKTGFTSPV